MQDQKPISHYIAGLIIAAIIIVYSIVLNFLDQMQNQALGWVAYGILAIGLIIFINMYAKARDNQVGFGGLFSYGFKATAIIALVLVVFLVGFFLLFPEFKDKIIEASRQGMEAQGKMTDEQIEQGLSMFSKNFLLFMVGGALFMYILIGTIASAIGAAITKKKPANPFEQMNR